jgi:hypothetical protein
MKKLLIMSVVVDVVFWFSCIYAHDNTDIHPAITGQAAMSQSLNFGNYLETNLNFEKGLDTTLPWSGKSQTITLWLREGSKQEDDPNCRASNHFHNPLALNWNESRMSDQPLWLTLWCSNWRPWYSNVTWATGYLAPPHIPTRRRL